MSRTPPEAVSLIKEFEGLRLEAYQCQAGVWTIGYGRTAGVRKGQTITEAEADEMLAQDLVNFEVEVDRLVTADVPDIQIGALVSLAYNIGLGAFGKSSLLKAVNAGQPVDALWLQWSFFTDATGAKCQSKGLLRRRRAELSLWHSSDIGGELLPGTPVIAGEARNPLPKSWTLRGAVMSLIGTIGYYLEVAFGVLTESARWVGEASSALGPLAPLGQTVSSAIPAAAAGLSVAGIVIVISRRVQGK